MRARAHTLAVVEHAQLPARAALLARLLSAKKICVGSRAAIALPCGVAIQYVAHAIPQIPRYLTGEFGLVV